MTNANRQDIDIHTTAEGFRYHRGSALSIFRSDRYEDFVALACALVIAFGVYILR
jgi:hypothetical protein